MKLLFLMIGLLQISSIIALAETKKIDLFVEKKSMNLSGKKEVDFALTVNGGIPAPTLRFQEGDTVEITVHNRLQEEVSIHWHGLLLPPEQDGVAYVNTPPIYAGKSHTFRFRLRQHGTYWYHSHTSVQEQKGVYGAFIIDPKKPKWKVDHDVVAVLSDWSDEDANKILNNLKKDGDYYLYKKNSIRSYFGAIGAGGLGEMLKNEWQRMGGMDLSDVGYDAFLINGKIDSQLIQAKAGDKVRIRIINSGASSYFLVNLAGLPFQVISADGVDVQPVWTKEVLLGMAETYDLLFTLPENKNYELLATVQDITGSASAWIGSGEKVAAPKKAALDLYAPMDHGSHSDHAGHGGSHETGEHDDQGTHKPQAEKKSHDAHANHSGHSAHADHAAHAAHADHANHSAHAAHADHAAHARHSVHGLGSKSSSSSKEVDPKNHSAHESTHLQKEVHAQVTVDQLVALERTSFPKEKSDKVLEVKLVLGGDMERYVWHINGKAIHQDRTLYIEEGQVIRYTFVNDTMMHHPMHLHGHFFRVLTKAGEKSPMKHTVDVPPHGQRTIEFFSDEPGEWMLHCHNLYHMKTGMARVVKYSTFRPIPEVEKVQSQDPHLHDHWYWTGSLELATQQGKAFGRVSRTWDSFELEVESKEENSKWEFEGDLLYRRWMGNFWNLTVGGTSFEENQRATGGVGVILPFLIESDFLVDHKGDIRMTAEKKFQWTSTILSEAEFQWREKHGIEWSANLFYQPSWHWGVGIFRNDEKWGFGGKVRF